jgi:hypothetical protein
MPAHHLNRPATTRVHESAPKPASTEVVDGVLAVLAGAPADHVAARIGMPAHDLADAIEAYHEAGRAAVEGQAVAGQ